MEFGNPLTSTVNPRYSAHCNVLHGGARQPLQRHLVMPEPRFERSTKPSLAAVPVNPFEYGRELAPKELADRVEIVEKVKKAMVEGRKLFLIGPRRYGKTSVLRAAEIAALAQGAMVLRYDTSAFPTITDLTMRLAADAAAAFAGTTDRIIGVAKEMFGKLHPTVTVDATGSTSLTLGAAAPSSTSPTKAIPLLSDVLNAIEQGARKSHRHVAVVLDEFQEVVERGGVEAESQIRAAVQRHRHVGYVFAGSKTRFLIDMTSHGRPFYNLGDREFLGEVPRPDFAITLAAGFAAGGIAVADGALDAIMTLAEDVPYTVQLIAHSCWDRCRASAPTGGQPTPLTPELVATVHDRVVREQDPYFSELWINLTPSQRSALLALVTTGGVGLASNAVARQYRTSVSTMQGALEGLKARGIVRERATAGVVRQRVDDPLFGAWVRLSIRK